MTLSTRSLLCLASAATVAELTIPERAVAQSVAVGLVSATANHYLLGGRLGGGSIRISYPVSHSRLSVRLSAERVSGDAQRFGTACGGFIPPGCDPEPLRDDARLTTVMAGAGLRVVSQRGFEVELVGDLGGGRVTVDTHGLSSGKTLAAQATIWGGSAGVEAAWSPWAGVPVAIEAGVSAGGFLPSLLTYTADGYTPFENDGFSITRLRAGLAWRRGRR